MPITENRDTRKTPTQRRPSHRFSLRGVFDVIPTMPRGHKPANKKQETKEHKVLAKIDTP